MKHLLICRYLSFFSFSRPSKDIKLTLSINFKIYKLGKISVIIDIELIVVEISERLVILLSCFVSPLKISSILFVYNY
jgi:hypothetical protein